jgi:hypothetical protein
LTTFAQYHPMKSTPIKKKRVIVLRVDDDENAMENGPSVAQRATETKQWCCCETLQRK